MSKIVRVPKEKFENYYLKEGGTLNEVLAGGVQLGLDKEKPIQEPNANIEDGEWVLDSNGLRQAKGETHEEGGIDVVLEDGTQILSNHTKVTSDIAKELGKKYDVKITVKDTYAQALEKIYKKLGIHKDNEAQEKIIDKLEKQQADVKDANTLALNTQALTTEINNIEEEKFPKELEAIEAFSKSFAHQESRKPKEEEQEYKEVFDDGGKYSLRLPNVFEDQGKFIKQHEVPGNSGTFGEIPKDQTAKEIQRLFPFMYQEYFNEQGVPKDSGEYQLGQQVYYQGLDESAKNIWGETSDRYKEFSTNLRQDMFGEGVRGFDSKFGNFTSTRPNYGFDILPRDVYEQMQSQGINTYGELADNMPELAEANIPKGYALPKDAWLLPIQEQNKEEVAEDIKKEVAKTPELAANMPTPPAGTQGTRFGMLDTPYNDLLPPSTLNTHLKARADLPTMTFTEQTPNQQLQQLQNIKSQADQNIDMLPPAQRAAVIADTSATFQENASKIVSETERLNRAGFDAVRNFNSQTITKQQMSDIQNALNYEQRQLLAAGKTEQDIRNYLNALERRQVGRYSDIQSLNLLNAKSPHYQFTDRGVQQVSDPKIILRAQPQPQAKEKNKKRFGGYIKIS